MALEQGDPCTSTSLDPAHTLRARTMKPSNNPEFIKMVKECVDRRETWSQVLAYIMKADLRNSVDKPFEYRDGGVICRICLQQLNGQLPTGEP